MSGLQRMLAIRRNGAQRSGEHLYGNTAATVEEISGLILHGRRLLLHADFCGSPSATAAMVGSLDEEPPKKTAGKAYNVFLQV